MRWVLLVFASVACNASQDQAEAEDVSCVVVSSSGTTCYQHSTTQPVERQMLDQTCGGTFHDDSCDDDNAIGACHLGSGALTVIYKGYQNVDGFVSVCKASGGSWEMY